LQQGLQQGIQHGVQLGEVLVLERLLVKRFGALSDETRQRLAQASAEQLETWTDRLLNAPTINAVFESD
jgi:hypothetical protein